VEIKPLTSGFFLYFIDMEVLDNLGKVIIADYQRLLEQAGKKASGALIGSLRYEVKIGEGFYEVVFFGEGYWKNVEFGRRGRERDNGYGVAPDMKFPPINEIKDLIRIKPILPTPDARGRIPDENQLAFLIARAITYNGILPTNAMTKTLETNENVIEQTSQMIVNEIIKKIDILWPQFQVV